MGRTHKRKPSSRPYKSWTSQQLQRALAFVTSGNSLRKASEAFKINRQTLKNKLDRKHTKTVGGQPVLSTQKETAIVQHCIALSDFGFPIAKNVTKKHCFHICLYK